MNQITVWERIARKAVEGVIRRRFNFETRTLVDGDLLAWNASKAWIEFRAALTAIAHAMTSAAHTATAWRTFYSDASAVKELANGAANTVYTSNGAAAAPSWNAGIIVTSVTSSGLVDVTGGGLRVRGDTSNPGASAGTTGARILASGQDSTTFVLYECWVGATRSLYMGVDSDTGSLAGVAKQSMVDFFIHDAAAYRFLLDASDNGRAIAGGGFNSGASYQHIGRELFAQFDHFADAGNLTATGETDLYSDTLPAAVLASNGDKIEARYAGSFVSSGTATRQVRLYFGGTLIYDSGTLTIAVGSDDWDMSVLIIRVSSSVVRCIVNFTPDNTTLASPVDYNPVTGLTLANTQILKITGQAAGVGSADNDIVAKLGTVRFVPAA